MPGETGRELSVQISGRKVLAGITVVTLLLLPVILFVEGPFRVALALPFALVFPGYSLLAALFPRRDDLPGVRRLAFSIGGSIVILSLAGLVLNFTTWGIQPLPVFIALSIFILATSFIGWRRQEELPQADRLSLHIGAIVPGWGGKGRLNRALSVFLIVAVAVAAGSLGYAITTPKLSESYTEFYIAPAEGGTEDYPTEINLGESLSLTVVVVNHEQEPGSYRIRVDVDGASYGWLETGILDPEGEWQEAVTITPPARGENQKVQLYLYAGAATEPYLERPLQLHLDVR